MTCQWCIKYRRRDGRSLCLTETEDGEPVLKPIQGLACGKFDPRKSCTTCEHRCSPDERETLLFMDGGCPKWELRNLTTWGGRRRFSRNGL